MGKFFNHLADKNIPSNTANLIFQQLLNDVRKKSKEKIKAPISMHNLFSSSLNPFALNDSQYVEDVSVKELKVIGRNSFPLICYSLNTEKNSFVLLDKVKNFRFLKISAIFIPVFITKSICLK